MCSPRSLVRSWLLCHRSPPPVSVIAYASLVSTRSRSPYYGGEMLVAQGLRIGDSPAVFGLEVIGETDEIVARVAVGAYDFIRLEQAVGSVGVAMEVATKEATYFLVLE